MELADKLVGVVFERALGEPVGTLLFLSPSPLTFAGVIIVGGLAAIDGVEGSFIGGG